MSRTSNYSADADLDRQSHEILVFNEALRTGRMCACGYDLANRMALGVPMCDECADATDWHNQAVVFHLSPPKGSAFCAECREPIAHTGELCIDLAHNRCMSGWA